MGDYDFDGRGSPLSADLVGFRRMMLVLRFNLLHRATLRQCATKAGCRLQFNSVISSFTRLSEFALARRARISSLLSPWESGHSTAMWKADCSAVPHAHIGLGQSSLWTLYKKPLRRLFL